METTKNFKRFATTVRTGSRSKKRLSNCVRISQGDSEIVLTPREAQALSNYITEQLNTEG